MVTVGDRGTADGAPSHSVRPTRSRGRSLFVVTLSTLVALASVLVGMQYVSTTPAAAASAPVIAPGILGYLPSDNPESPGSTTAPTPNQVKVTTLVTGGSADVDTASLTIVTQSASGTAAANTTTDVVTWTPTTSTSGIQTVTFALCAPTIAYSAGNPLCTDATLTFNPATVQPMGENVNAPIEGATPVEANLVVAKVSNSGTVSIYNFTGSTNVVVDVEGWYQATT